MRYPEDKTRFGLDALLHGERFYRHPRIQRLLADLPNKTGYNDASAELEEKDWAEIETAILD